MKIGDCIVTVLIIQNTSTIIKTHKEIINIIFV